MTHNSLLPLSACRTACDEGALLRSFLDHLYCLSAKTPANATDSDLYLALAYTVRDRLMQRWVTTSAIHSNQAPKRLCYLSAEYLLGPHLRNALYSLNIEEATRAALATLELDLDHIAAQEPEPGLGNSELGRLSACALDAMANLEIPTIAYGIRYEFGLFEQVLLHGQQIEHIDKWLRIGNPWEISRPEFSYKIGFGGRTQYYEDSVKGQRVRWFPERFIKGIAYDTPIPGHGVATVNLLRLWSAEAYEAFDVQAFNLGDYQKAIEKKITSEAISKVLYLDDEPAQGRGRRLEQHYFLVSCAMQDLIRIYLLNNSDLTKLASAFAIQINDAHPALAVAELMRLLVDEYALSWDDAWNVAYTASAYTSHSLLPEVLESWPVEIFEAVLPRHLEIIYEINHRFLEKVRLRWPADQARLASLSLINEQGGRRVRMAHLACVGSQYISGVVDPHSQLPRDSVLKNFYELDPTRFIKITNGVSHQRFLVLANPALTKLIIDTIGSNWLRDLEYLQDLIPWAESPEFRNAWRTTKQFNKQKLALKMSKIIGKCPDPSGLFDIHVKRVHEYKRQHLSILHVIQRYFSIKDNQDLTIVPRVWIYAGKAAPGAFLAQLMIELILSVAKVINRDPAVQDKMCIAFFPNFAIKNAGEIYPAADLSEQITTAGKEPSGVGAVKFALNGALTIGTQDGSNVDMQSNLGAEHYFSFGMNEAQIRQCRMANYRPRDYYESDPELRLAIDSIAQGYFSGGDTNRFRPLLDALINWDGPFVLADFASYIECQRRIDSAWKDQDGWTRSSILNTARCGNFSSNKTIRSYCKQTWSIQSV